MKHSRTYIDQTIQLKIIFLMNNAFNKQIII